MINKVNVIIGACWLAAVSAVITLLIMKHTKDKDFEYTLYDDYVNIENYTIVQKLDGAYYSLIKDQVGLDYYTYLTKDSLKAKKRLEEDVAHWVVFKERINQKYYQPDTIIWEGDNVK